MILYVIFDIIVFQAFDTLYYTGTGNSNDLDAIDTDGGPYIGKGHKITIDKEELKNLQI